MAAKKAPSAKPNRPVTLKHLAHALAESHELTKKQGEALLGDLVGMITKHLKKGEKLRLTGLGVLQVRKRAARMGRMRTASLARERFAIAGLRRLRRTWTT